MLMNDLPDLNTLLQTPKKVVITAHARPDGDAIGSALGLFHFLKGRGHQVHVIVPDDFPGFLKWMPGSDEIIVFESNVELAVETVNKSEIMFSLDYNDTSRLNKLQESFDNHTATKVLIDHHLNPTDFADLNFSSTKAAATAELVFDIIQEMNAVEEISEDAANCLYVGILTDTGMFQYSNTSTNVLKIAAILVEKGVTPYTPYNHIYNSFSLGRMKLFGHGLRNLKLNKELGIAYIPLTADSMRHYNAQPGDTEGLVNEGLRINGVTMSILLKEDKKIIKMSFRSKGDRAVNELASTYFEGGGHKNAAGGRSLVSMTETIEKILKVVETEKY